MLDGKFGLSNDNESEAGNFFINSSRQREIIVEIQKLQESGNSRGAARLENELALLNELQAGSRELDHDGRSSVEEDFNPDFLPGSVSFGYNNLKQSDRAEDFKEDLSKKSPNVAFPVGGFANGQAGSGGYGNSANENSVADGLIDSVQVLAKYGNN